MKKQPINRIEIGKGLSVIHNSGNVMTLYIDNVFEGWEQWLLLSSDRHHDSIDCNRELELEHLEECKKRKAFIIDVGDMYDCMQGRFDPRKSYKNLRPEYKEDDYLDVIVKDAAEFYSPFVNQFLMIGRGNHESAVLKNNSTDLIDRTVYELNSHYSGHIQAGGYGGWVRILWKYPMRKRQDKIFSRFGGGRSGHTRRYPDQPAGCISARCRYSRKRAYS